MYPALGAAKKPTPPLVSSSRPWVRPAPEPITGVTAHRAPSSIDVPTLSPSHAAHSDAGTSCGDRSSFRLVDVSDRVSPRSNGSCSFSTTPRSQQLGVACPLPEALAGHAVSNGGSGGVASSASIVKEELRGQPSSMVFRHVRALSGGSSAGSPLGPGMDRQQSGHYSGPLIGRTISDEDLPSAAGVTSSATSHTDLRGELSCDDDLSADGVVVAEQVSERALVAVSPKAGVLTSKKTTEVKPSSSASALAGHRSPTQKTNMSPLAVALVGLPASPRGPRSVSPPRRTAAGPGHQASQSFGVSFAASLEDLPALGQKTSRSPRGPDDVETYESDYESSSPESLPRRRANGSPASAANVSSFGAYIPMGSERSSPRTKPPPRTPLASTRLDHTAPIPAHRLRRSRSPLTEPEILAREAGARVNAVSSFARKPASPVGAAPPMPTYLRTARRPSFTSFTSDTASPPPHAARRPPGPTRAFNHGDRATSTSTAGSSATGPAGRSTSSGFVASPVASVSPSAPPLVPHPPTSSAVGAGRTRSSPRSPLANSALELPVEPTAASRVEVGQHAASAEPITARVLNARIAARAPPRLGLNGGKDATPPAVQLPAPLRVAVHNEAPVPRSGVPLSPRHVPQRQRQEQQQQNAGRDPPPSRSPAVRREGPSDEAVEGMARGRLDSARTNRPLRPKQERGSAPPTAPAPAPASIPPRACTSGKDDSHKHSRQTMTAKPRHQHRHRKSKGTPDTATPLSVSEGPVESTAAPPLNNITVGGATAPPRRPPTNGNHTHTTTSVTVPKVHSTLPSKAPGRTTAEEDARRGSRKEGRPSGSKPTSATGTTAGEKDSTRRRSGRTVGREDVRRAGPTRRRDSARGGSDDDTARRPGTATRFSLPSTGVNSQPRPTVPSSTNTFGAPQPTKGVISVFGAQRLTSVSSHGSGNGGGNGGGISVTAIEGVSTLVAARAMAGDNIHWTVHDAPHALRMVATELVAGTAASVGSAAPVITAGAFASVMAKAGADRLSAVSSWKALIALDAACSLAASPTTAMPARGSLRPGARTNAPTISVETITRVFTEALAAFSASILNQTWVVLVGDVMLSQASPNTTGSVMSPRFDCAVPPAVMATTASLAQRRASVPPSPVLHLRGPRALEDLRAKTVRNGATADLADAVRVVADQNMGEVTPELIAAGISAPAHPAAPRLVCGLLPVLLPFIPALLDPLVAQVEEERVKAFAAFQAQQGHMFQQFSMDYRHGPPPAGHHPAPPTGPSTHRPSLRHGEHVTLPPPGARRTPR